MLSTMIPLYPSFTISPFQTYTKHTLKKLINLCIMLTRILYRQNFKSYIKKIYNLELEIVISILFLKGELQSCRTVDPQCLAPICGTLCQTQSKNSINPGLKSKLKNFSSQNKLVILPIFRLGRFMSSLWSILGPAGAWACSPNPIKASTIVFVLLFLFSFDVLFIVLKQNIVNFIPKYYDAAHKHVLLRP